ncbi:uncharacterized protein LOC126804047 [Argentina anserina]|uniref:uncharacterized protein LOC126804047 n=1 Tax=Argentina anserina TaxID=57926 RepID=UPI0021763BA3|nr:uncharacterized protein LOC126804047 [Potentilla anserina]
MSYQPSSTGSTSAASINAEQGDVDDKAPLWIYANKIEKMPGGGSWRFQCKFCEKSFVGSHNRVATHLLKDGGKGIKHCLKVTPQQHANMSKLLNDCKQRVKNAAPRPVPLPSSSRNASTSSLDYDMSYHSSIPTSSATEPKKRRGMGTALEKAFQNNSREQCDGEIARMFYTGGLSFNLARNPHYRLSYVRASSLPGYVPPGYNALRTTLLQKEKKNLQLHLQPIKDSWNAKGVSICSDGWSDPQRRPIINLIAANANGPMMLRAVNTQGEIKTGDMIVDLIIECIKEVGHENIVQIVTDNAANCVKAGAIISSKYPSIFWTPCVVHTLNLAVKNICAPSLQTRNNDDVYDACKWIGPLAYDVSFIKNFIMNHGMRLVMFTEHCDLKLLTIASTRFASTLVMFKRFKKIKAGLQHMVISNKWDDYKEDDVRKAAAVKQKILDEMFWDELDYVISFTEPIYSMIRRSDTDKSSLHLVYEWWEDMIQNVKKAIYRKERKQLHEDSSFWNVVHKVLMSRWSKSSTPLHCMAHSLNPKYYSPEWLLEDSTRKAPHQDIDITRERKNCILKYFDDADQRREVNVEYSNFSLCMDDFCNVDAMHDRSILHPLKWWAVHGASSPRLQALAFKLLRQPSSSSCCERNWSTYKFIHSATRNKITPQRAEDLVYVHTNLRLVSRCSDSYKEGPFHMWDVGGDQFDSLDETNLGRLEFEDLSLDEPTLEAVLFDNVQENVHEDDVVDV